MIKYAMGLCLLAVSACGSSSSSGEGAVQSDTQSATESHFETPDGQGTIGQGFAEDGQSVTGMGDGALNGGYAYQIGETMDGGYSAVAGIIPGTAVTAPPTSGSVDYGAFYEAKTLDNIREVDGELHAFGGVGVNGEITLTANFDDNTLTGEAATGTASAISFDGAIDGTDLTGTVTFRGMEGALTGMAGSDQIVGTFAGNNDTGVFAGGVTGLAVP